MIDLESIPSKPGCYIYKDKVGKIIYVGKAKNLKKRVSSYFQKNHDNPKTQALVDNINGADFIVTNSEAEALILENNLIKKHSPKYNIDLKDSKTYSFLKFTDDKFPRIIVGRSREKTNDAFGPFVVANDRRSIFEFVNKAFKLRTCKRMPRKECLRFHIGICSAPCIGKITQDDYASLVSKAKKVLAGKSNELEADLKNELKECAGNQEFEKAIIIREQVRAINYLKQSQIIQRNKKNNEHFIDYIIDEGSIYIMVFKVSNGLVNEKDEFIFDYSPDFFRQFIVQYYSQNDAPKIVVARKINDSSIAEFLSLKNPKSKIFIPKSGDKLKMLDLVRKNIREKFLRSKDSLFELKEALNLESLPKIIEGFDISHLSGTNTVASMVRFRNGEPDKDEYRRFKIKTLNGEIDDFKAMKEVVLRRYKRLILEGKPLPDLVLIDGGLGQLSSAVRALKSLQANIPLASIAKKFEEIWIPNRGSPLRMDKKSNALKLLQRVRDESHRFAISYNKLLRRQIFKE